MRPRTIRLSMALVSALLCGIFAAGLEAQTGRLSGVVTDQQTGQPLAGVQVFLEGTGRGALTQENGRYFMINVAPGSYTLVAQLIGYATIRREGVLVAIDGVRQVNFELPSEAIALEMVIVEAERVPLINAQATGSADVVTAAEIESLPVTGLAGVLALQHGFLELPDNTDVVSFVDSRRGLEPVHIRGGRAGETLTLVDGIPVSNFVFGGPAFFVNRKAVEQMDYIRGGFDAKYGNALSGIINVATKEGGTQLRGAMEYQTSHVGSWLGSRYDDLRDYRQAEGYVSGPVPGTGDRLRFMVAGRESGGADRVLRFDDMVYNPLQLERDGRNNTGSIYDLHPGWRKMGFDHTRDVFGKVSFYVTPLAKFNLTVMDYGRQRQPFDFNWLQTGFSLVDQCKTLYPEWEDVCERSYVGGRHVERIEDLRGTNQENTYVHQSSINLDRRLVVGRWDHTLGSRARYTLALGQFDQGRNTCTFLSGVCLQDKLAYTYWNSAFIYTGQQRAYNRHPIFGTDEIFGGEEVVTRVGRLDLEWQATDHHNLQTGAFLQSHDVSFLEGRDVGLNNVELALSAYAAKPWDAALYVQDRIEYDFITVNLGFRFDYGRAGGRFFADPRDPTNGTTARDVCEDPTRFGFAADHFRAQFEGEWYGGLAACSINDDLMDVARAKAFEDDFVEAPARTQFSPRLGFSFPVTESSSVMFNVGRYAQNPTLHSLYRGTGIGTGVEGTPDAPIFVSTRGVYPLLGNPRLPTEKTTLYEVGYLASLMDDAYGVSVVLFNKDQSGLTGIRQGGVRPDGSPVIDPGGTYGGAIRPLYDVLMNLDFQTSRGMEVSLRRRLHNYWAFDLRYSFAQIRTNAAPPDLEQQKQAEGDPLARTEIRSSIDVPHVLNGVLRLAVGNNTPGIPLGEWLRNTSLSVIARGASGLPYTPQIDFSGNQRLERNSGTAPFNFNVDAYAGKDWRQANMRYGVFVRGTNLFDRRNCLQVFPSTGRCDSGAITQARLLKGGASATNTISQVWDRPQMVSNPRSFNAGIHVTF
jgi:hypothetical protein